MDRRKFLEIATLAIGAGFVPPRLAAGSARSANSSSIGKVSNYGSGHFGSWITDDFGMPAYQYTCNQTTDPKAALPVNKAWRSPTDHMHQVGNDRLVAVASNYGYVQVRQDEGSPKFLNDHFPENNRYGAGIGFLGDGELILTTYYSGNSTGEFERVLGIGYLRKRVTSDRYDVDQVIFAPFGDDPVLVSQVTVTNRSSEVATPRWVEYWGCHNYQFSYRTLMEATVAGSGDAAPQMRRDFSDLFNHRIQVVKNKAGLIESQVFRGRAPAEEAAWKKVQVALKKDPTGFYGGPVPPLAHGASMEDLAPPSTFLVSLDAPADAFSTNATNFFRGGIDRPLGMAKTLDDDLRSSGPESALFLERRLSLQPHESRTMYFLYGYLPEGFELEKLVEKYSSHPASLWERSNARWKATATLFRTEAEPWVERESAWSSYYLRSGLTYDSFFHEHILSQGASYQYFAGLQGAARDPLQHVLPLVFTDPAIVREVIRYTLKEIQPDGSLPYGIVGSSVPMPCIYRPSDSELWVLWVASEYVLATRDRSFLEQRIAKAPRGEVNAEDPTVMDLLAQCYAHSKNAIGTGQHGLLRLSNGDWNDSIVVTHLTPSEASEVREHTESVLNSAMAGYVLDHYARMLKFAGQTSAATEAQSLAKAHRDAVRRQWTGRWFRRAWLGEQFGWVGEKQMWLEPQPWAIIGGSATPEQVNTLTSSINQLMRKPSPIGALLQSQPDPTMKDEPGTGTNGGIFAAINGTLIWALAMVDGEAAWDEWKKNTLARHAAVYPDMWFGIWSGPDAYNSVLAKNPGGTGPDFPVLNMHSHAWPLYSAAKLLGLNFHERGVTFRPVIPVEQYEYASSVIGFSKTAKGYSGWYEPLAPGNWTVEITLPEKGEKIQAITVNGISEHPDTSAGKIRFSGASRPGNPLRWELSYRR